MYFANDHNVDNWIDADISYEVINNIRLEKSRIIVWIWVLHNWKLKFENLNIDIDKDKNYKENSIRIVADFPEINSESNTNKKIRFVLTDVKAEWENWKKISNNNLDDGDSEYLLNDDIWKDWISWYRITTRKSTFSIKNTPIIDLYLDNWFIFR